MSEDVRAAQERLRVAQLAADGLDSLWADEQQAAFELSQLCQDITDAERFLERLKAEPGFIKRFVRRGPERHARFEQTVAEAEETLRELTTQQSISEVALTQLRVHLKGQIELAGNVAQRQERVRSLMEKDGQLCQALSTMDASVKAKQNDYDLAARALIVGSEVVDALEDAIEWLSKAAQDKRRAVTASPEGPAAMLEDSVTGLGLLQRVRQAVSHLATEHETLVQLNVALPEALQQTSSEWVFEIFADSAAIDLQELSTILQLRKALRAHEASYTALQETLIVRFKNAENALNNASATQRKLMAGQLTSV